MLQVEYQVSLENRIRNTFRDLLNRAGSFVCKDVTFLENNAFDYAIVILDTNPISLRFIAGRGELRLEISGHPLYRWRQVWTNVQTAGDRGERDPEWLLLALFQCEKFVENNWSELIDQIQRESN
jgi:hypothetical protein